MSGAVEALVNPYCEYLATIRDFDAKTLVLHRRALAQFHTFLETRGADGLRPQPADLVAWITTRLEAGISRTTIRGQLCVLRTFYSYVKEFGHSGGTALELLPEMICEQTAEQHYMTVAECRRLLDVFDSADPIGQRNRMLVALLWSTGLRTAELCALKWRDIDLEDASLLVRRGKNRRQRLVFLNDRVLADLRGYREISRPEGGPSPVLPAMRGAAWPEGRRLPITAGGVCTVLQTHAPRAGIGRPVSPKTLRHTFATHMYERGASVADIQEMMGHSTDTETCIYIHVTVEAARQLLLDHMANQAGSGRRASP